MYAYSIALLRWFMQKTGIYWRVKFQLNVPHNSAKPTLFSACGKFTFVMGEIFGLQVYVPEHYSF
jgi:hypothetical protein